MNKRHRNRLLWLASILDRRATAIRAYVKRKTPKRNTRPMTPNVSEPGL